MFQIQKRIRTAVALGALSVAAAGCKSGPPAGSPGTKQQQSAIEKAQRDRPNHDKRYHPYNIADLEAEFTKRYNDARDVHKGLMAARLGVIKNIAGKPAEAKALLIEAMQKMEDLNVSGAESLLATKVNLQNLSNFRGSPWERAYNRVELAYALYNLGDASNARASLRGALEHLAGEKKELPKTEEQAKKEAAESKENKPAEGEARVVEPEANRSSLGVLVAIFAAKLSLDLADPASAENYLNQARFFDAANQKAGLSGSEIPSIEVLEANPLIIVSAGMGPLIIKTGNSLQYRAVVPGVNHEVKFEFSAADGKVEFSPDKPTASLTVEAQMEAKAKIDQYVEDKEIRADDREVGFVYPESIYAKAAGFPVGQEMNLTFNAENRVYVGGLFADGDFVRDTQQIKRTLQSVTVVRLVPDYPPTCTTAEEAAKLDKVKAAEAPKKPSKFMEILDRNIKPRR